MAASAAWALEKEAQKVLELRQQFPEISLAKLYEPASMKATGLLSAHRALDAAVERAYGRKLQSDAERVAYLFELYRCLTAAR